jgi:hypothetical protein
LLKEILVLMNIKSLKINVYYYLMIQKEIKKFVINLNLVKLSEIFENNLEIIGCSAIEDKL